MCVDNIFFKTKQMKILLGQSQVALRKCQRNNRSIKAGQLKQSGASEQLVRQDEGFKFLSALRGSPPYFERAKKYIFAMITHYFAVSLLQKHNGFIFLEYLANLSITANTLTLS